MSNNTAIRTSINLLPQEEFNVSITGRVLKWAMGTFRIIVIVTEMIVMAAFLSRFWLDAQNSDLNDAIKVKSAQITAQTSVEKEFRAVQSKVNIFKEIQTGAKPAQIVDAITSKLPANAVLTGISVSQGSALINGTSEGETGIAQFITNLKSDNTFKNVDLTGVDSSENNPAQIIFSVNITY
jgi:Tfp pilus assembly protein PilN